MVPLCALVFALAAPATAHAEPRASDPAAAQALFYKARGLMQQGRYAEACPTLEESLRLDAGVGTRFNLADCNEHIGKVATAWAGFLDVAAASKAASQVERERLARQRARALETRLPKLVVDVSGAPTGLEVKCDGHAIAPSAYGAEVPIDPGVHHVSATAPGRQPWETTVHTIESKTVHVLVPRDLPKALVATTTSARQPEPEPQPQPEPPPSPVAGGAMTTASSVEPARDFPPPVIEDHVSPQRIAGWVIAGAGVIGAGVGAGFGLSSIGAGNESRSHCVGDLCDTEGVRLRDDAIRHGNIATISMIAGGAAIAGGLILVLTAPSGNELPERSGKLRAVPHVAREGGGLLLEGSFQ